MKFNNDKVNQVINIVSKEFNVNVSAFSSKSKKRDHVYFRFFVFYFLHKYMNMSMTAIGVLADKKHCTVISGLKNHQNLIETDRIYRERFKFVENKVHHLF